MTMAETYNQTGYTEGYPPGIERHFWNIARNDLVYRWLQPRLKQGELVMDVGCGTGIVVSDLKSRGLNIQGVELGPAPITPGLESDIRTDTNLFDLDEALKHEIRTVLLLDVIEHMQERREFLQRIHRELPNCHTVLVTVPARMEIWSEYDKYWGHHLRFDRPGLGRDIAAGGYTVNKSAYFFHWIYFVSLVLRVFGLAKSTDFQPIAERGIKAFFHRLLGSLTRLESRLLPGWFPGSSIICLASRSTDSYPISSAAQE